MYMYINYFIGISGRLHRRPVSNVPYSISFSNYTSACAAVGLDVVSPAELYEAYETGMLDCCVCGWMGATHTHIRTHAHAHAHAQMCSRRVLCLCVWMCPLRWLPSKSSASRHAPVTLSSTVLDVKARARHAQLYGFFASALLP